MSKRMILMLVITGLVLGAVFGLKAFGTYMMNQAVNNTPPPAASVSSAEVQQDNWVRSLTAVGTVRPVNGVMITSEVPGIVRELAFSSSQIVKQGAILARLDSAQDRAQLDALRAAARLAELEYQRFQELFRQGSISRSELDRRESERDQAAAAAAAQQELVEKKTLRAPFTGKLGIRQVDLGQYLAAGTPVVAISQADPIYVDFALPEKHMFLIRDGLEVEVNLSALPDKTFTGAVTATETGVDAGTRNFNVRATFPNPDRLLRPGMFADVRIQLDSTDPVLVVPRTAVRFAPYGNSVFVIETGTTEAGDEILTVSERLVRLGRQRGDMVAISEGLELGERVVTSGLLKLRNGASVKIENDVVPPAQTNPKPENS